MLALDIADRQLNHGNVAAATAVSACLPRDAGLKDHVLWCEVHAHVPQLSANDSCPV